MRNRLIMLKKRIGALLLCIAMVSSFAGCNKNDAERKTLGSNENEDNGVYNITENDYDAYVEYENMFLSAETAYLNDDGYVENSDIPAMLDEVQQLAQQGVSNGTIDYYNREDDNIFIKFSSGIPYLFVPYQKDMLSGGGGGQILTLEPNADDYSVNLSYVIATATAWGCGIEYEDSLRPSSNANLIVDHVSDLYTYDYRYELPYDVIDPIYGAGDSLRNLNVTIESMKALADYKIIIWEGHGAYNEKIHSALITGESFVGWKEFSKYKKDLEDNTIILTSFPTIPETDIAYSPIRYYGITSKFVEKYIGDMDDSLIFLGACSSLKDEVLAQSFLDKGASVVLGYTKETTMYYEMISRTVFFAELVQENDFGYQTVADAYHNTINVVGSDNGCVLSCISQDGIAERYTLNGILEPEAAVEYFETFADVIENVQTSINYNSYSASQKEYCRGDFFEIDGQNALVLMYHVLNSTELTPGYYVGLWVENSDGTISCLTDQLIEEVGDPDDAYVTVNIRKIDGKMYLNPYVRTTNNNTDISKNQYYLIGDELVLEYNLQSEAPFVSMGDGLIQHDDSKSVYYLNQEQIDRSTFYSTQDKLNIRTYILGLDPNWSEGLPPQGYTFEELLAQLPTGTTSNDSGTNIAVSTEATLTMYADVVRDCMEICGFSSMKSEELKNDCRGLLYDVDGDDKEELVLQYISNHYEPIIEVWDIENGAPTCLLSSSKVTAGSSVSGICLYLGEYDGQRCLIFNWWGAGSSESYSAYEVYSYGNDRWEKSKTITKSQVESVVALMCQTGWKIEYELQESILLPELLGYLDEL